MENETRLQKQIKRVQAWFGSHPSDNFIQDLTPWAFVVHRAGCEALQLLFGSPEPDILRDRHEVYDRRAGA